MIVVQQKKPLVCLVFGRASVAARHIALRFASEGGHIVLAGTRGDLPHLEQIVRQCASIGSPSGDCQLLDWSKVEEVDEVVNSVLSRQGSIDILVNVAEEFPDAAPAAPTPSGEKTSDEKKSSSPVAMRLTNLVVEHIQERLKETTPHKRAVINVLNGGNAAAQDLKQWSEENYKALKQQKITVLCIDTEGGASPGPEIGDLALLPFSDSGDVKDSLPWMVKLSDATHGAHWPLIHSMKRAAIATVHEVTAHVPSLAPEANAQAAPPSRYAGGYDAGTDPGPNLEGTMRHDNKDEVLHCTAAEEAFGGIIAATGERKADGLLQRPAQEGEIGHAKADRPGAVMYPADPGNLEPEEGHFYSNEPDDRDPRMLVQCFKPYNAETPHGELASGWITDAGLHYVRNHLPVPKRVDIQTHKIRIEIDGVPGMHPAEFSVPELRAKFPRAELHATLECAGNRRNEACTVHVVCGRAPWNHGAIGNSKWGGVWLRDVLRHLGLNLEACRVAPDPPAKHVWFGGMDFHHETKEPFQVSIPIEKAVDALGDCMIAWEQNGEELTMDHGYPVRVIIPGYVGTRSCKWLCRIVIAQTDSKSGWQQKDYKQFPPAVKTLEDAAKVVDSMPPIMAMPTNSAILVPESGMVIPRDTKAILVKGYALAGGGLPVIRVDVSADGGSSWERADIVEQRLEPHERSWSWVLWEIPLKVPPQLRAHGGKLELCCKAWNRNYDSQPRTVDEVWNFRGLNTNSWHFVTVRVA